MEKGYLYVGHYIDTEGNYILKVGKTNDLERRRKEHCRNYKKAIKHTLPKEEEFVYDWHLQLSKYTSSITASGLPITRGYCPLDDVIFENLTFLN